MKQPDARKSVANYQRPADRYDASCRRVMPIREEAVALLNLQPGDIVVDKDNKATAERSAGAPSAPAVIDRGPHARTAPRISSTDEARAAQAQARRNTVVDNCVAMMRSIK